MKGKVWVQIVFFCFIASTFGLSTCGGGDGPKIPDVDGDLITTTVTLSDGCELIIEAPVSVTCDTDPDPSDYQAGSIVSPVHIAGTLSSGQTAKLTFKDTTERFEENDSIMYVDSEGKWSPVSSSVSSDGKSISATVNHFSIWGVMEGGLVVTLTPFTGVFPEDPSDSITIPADTSPQISWTLSGISDVDYYMLVVYSPGNPDASDLGEPDVWMLDQIPSDVATITYGSVPSGATELVPAASLQINGNYTVWVISVNSDIGIGKGIVTVTGGSDPGTLVLSPDGLWHETEHRAHGGTSSWYYGQEDVWNFDTGATNSGSLTSEQFYVQPGSTLSFWYWLDTEHSKGAAHSYDLALVQISTDGGSTWDTLLDLVDTVNNSTEDTWELATADLFAYAGETAVIRFYFDSADDVSNNYEGWYVDQPFILSMTPDGLWHETAHRTYDGTTSWYYGQEGFWNFDTGTANSGSLITQPFTVQEDSRLGFWYWLDTEYGKGLPHSFGYDEALVQISTDGGSTWDSLLDLVDTVNNSTENTWELATANLSGYAGETAVIRFYFDSVDNIGNSYEGWYVDAITVSAVEEVYLYGTTHGNLTLGASILYELSMTDGTVLKNIGSVGYYVNGLEYDAVSGKLYGTTSNNDPVFPNGLIEINRLTGAGTPIGSGAGTYINNPTVNSAGEMFAWTEWSDDLVTVDTAAGTATVVGDSGLSTMEHGLAFDNDDNLYMVNYDGAIYAIDPMTGGATYTATIGTRAHHGDFHPLTGLYWGIDLLYYAGPTRNLLVVDIETPSIEDTISAIDNLHAVTFCYKE